MDAKWIEEVVNKISHVVASSPVGDVERNVRALLQGAFARLDLVTREEFDVQARVLAKTRERLEQMSARLDALEQAQDHPSPPAE